MKVTFLEAGNGSPLSKHYYASGEVRPYPHVKDVTSYEHDVPVSKAGLQQLETLLRSNASAGRCMLKGPLRRPLVNESRAQKSDRLALTSLLVLDFDSILLPRGIIRNGWKKLTNQDVQNISQQIVAELPSTLQDVSYIAQASASLGMKGERISMHIFMFLTVPMPPKSVKLWLQDVNYTSDTFKNQLQLSANGQSLRYPLDSSVADNSKLIFIAPPSFEDPTHNPFANDTDRIVLVDRNNASLDLAAMMSTLNPETSFQLGQQIKDDLREVKGIRKKTGKFQTLTVDYQAQEVLLNPDKMSITIADSSTMPWVRCNINGGDSGAYYFNIERPTYMYNFKDEPIFEIEKADKEFYKSIFEMFQSHLEKSGRATYPVVLRDYYTDCYYNGVFDPNLNQFTEEYPLIPTSKASIQSFMMSHGRPEPDFVRDARVVFDPTSDSPSIDFDNVPYFVNMFRKTKYMLHPDKPSRALGFGTAHEIKNDCPRIYTLIKHVLGDGDLEVEYFLNWIAYVFQTRKKAKTAWVLGGVPGTGKGLFYSRVLRPLFGPEHVPMRSLQSIEEHFNLYMRNSLFLIVDEFHMASSSLGAMKIADKLKNQITEDTITIRAMRTNQIEVPNYTNFIFLTNRNDAVKIENGDRRYNIPPRQERKLEEAHPLLLQELDHIETELPKLAGYLTTFKVNERMVHTCIDNGAKSTMRNVSMTIIEEFAEALKQGNLLFFSDILDINTANVPNMNEVATAQRLVKSWIASAKEDFAIIPMEHLRTVFHVQTEANPRMSQREFAKQMSRNGITTSRKRAPGAPREANALNGVLTNWAIDDFDRQRLINTYFDGVDQRQLLQNTDIGYTQSVNSN
jgi:hypothetical protein